ncbi:MAG: MoaD family protein [Promethearchaeota archaeon]
MANVTLKLMTIFSTDIGLTQINYSNVEILGDLIDQFMLEYGKKIRKSFLTPQGRLETHIVILVNGRNYQFLEGLKTELKDGDEVVISPPLVGG